MATTWRNIQTTSPDAGASMYRGVSDSFNRAIDSATKQVTEYRDAEKERNTLDAINRIRSTTNRETLSGMANSVTPEKLFSEYGENNIYPERVFNTYETQGARIDEKQLASGRNTLEVGKQRMAIEDLQSGEALNTANTTWLNPRQQAKLNADNISAFMEMNNLPSTFLTPSGEVDPDTFSGLDPDTKNAFLESLVDGGSKEIGSVPSRLATYGEYLKSKGVTSPRVYKKAMTEKEIELTKNPLSVDQQTKLANTQAVNQKAFDRSLAQTKTDFDRFMEKNPLNTPKTPEELTEAFSKLGEDVLSRPGLQDEKTLEGSKDSNEIVEKLGGTDLTKAINIIGLQGVKIGGKIYRPSPATLRSAIGSVLERDQWFTDGYVPREDLYTAIVEQSKSDPNEVRKSKRRIAEDAFRSDTALLEDLLSSKNKQAKDMLLGASGVPTKYKNSTLYSDLAKWKNQQR